MSGSELTEDQKLVKLGLRSPNQTQSSATETLQAIKNAFSDWGAFQENFEDANLSTFDEFEQFLIDNGIEADTAKSIRDKLVTKYESFSDFKTSVIDEYESFDDWGNDFASNTGFRSTRTTDEGLSAAGMRVYEESGVGRSGQNIPAGGVEIYGAEVYFSETSSVQDTEDESAGGDDPIVWDNLSVDPNSGRVGDAIAVEADVTNNTGFAGSVVAELIVDGEVRSTARIELNGNTTKTVSFEYTAGEDGTGTFDIGISKAGTEEVQVIYGGL